MNEITDDEHGGNIRKLAEASGQPAKELLDFSANINPLGPPEWLRSWISSQWSSIVHYPDPDCSLLKASISHRYGVREEEVLVGNGSSEIIYILPQGIALCSSPHPSSILRRLRQGCRPRRKTCGKDLPSRG
jgi:adenosylcobyric acid synthase